MNLQKEKIKTVVNQLELTNTPPGYIWDSRMFDWKDCDLWIILGGRGILRTPDDTLELLPGDCLLLRPEEKYFFKNNTQNIVNTFYVHYDYVDSNMNIISPDKIKLPPFYRHITDEFEFLYYLIDRIDESHKNNDRNACNLWLEAILEEIDRQHEKNKLSNLKIKQKQIFNTLCGGINKNPGNSYKIPELAKKVHYNHQYFSSLFKKYKGISPSEFIIQARIKAAKRLLHLTDEPIGQIADILNYSDIYSFSKQFRKKTGATPSEYRKLVNKK
jgi:AraC-like DNA-binding protein